MMKLIAPFLLVFIVGCSTLGIVSPETPRERLVAAELTYEAVLTSVRDLVVAGTIVKNTDTGDQIANAIVAARTALDVWQLTPDNRDNMTLALTTLQTLQGVLNTIQAGASP